MKKDLSLWAAFDAIEQLAKEHSFWFGDGDALVDIILDITNTKITQFRREWLITELATLESRHILLRRDVDFFFGESLDPVIKWNPNIKPGPGVKLGGVIGGSHV